jgi:hypothetical protein
MPMISPPCCCSAFLKFGSIFSNLAEVTKRIQRIKDVKQLLLNENYISCAFECVSEVRTFSKSNIFSVNKSTRIEFRDRLKV